ncbi:MAG TPA: ComF family protein [Candidatus Faecalibacterium faecipullorum]|uniref:ComF family protein n=1 Tax=Candidatus Faecalibacterium faecipullorum TaxID=2838578 RepID=A0A9D2MG79_9FIRM|nr:ComF family protein [Candidatus Faecalibacterium faecipullorum]
MIPRAGLGSYSRGAILFRQGCQLLLPRRCPLCRRVLGSLPVCPDCAQELDYCTRSRGPGPRSPLPHLPPDAVAWAAAPFWYHGGIRSAILRAKYGDQPWVAVQLGCMAAERLFGAEIRVRGGVEVPVPLAAPVVDCDILVPVPSSGRGRAYNLPALAGLPIARALGIPMEEHALLRTRRGSAQAGASREERLVNTLGLFKGDARLVSGCRVLLLDDVLTTGATALACVRALQAAGAEWTAVIALATPTRNFGLPAAPGIPFDRAGGYGGEPDEPEELDF